MDGRQPLWKLLTFVVYQLLPLAPVVAVGLDLIDPKAPFRVLQLLISMAFTGSSSTGWLRQSGPSTRLPPTTPTIRRTSRRFRWVHSPSWVRPATACPRCILIGVSRVLAAEALWRVGACPRPALRLLDGFRDLGLGEHYVIDLVVALPFVVTFLGLWVTGLGWKTPARYQSVLGGLALTVCWLVLLRTQAGVLTGSPAVLWGLTLVTVAGSLSLERRLQFAASTCIRVMRSSVRSLSPAGEDSLSPLAAGTLPLDGEAPSRGF